MDATPPSSLRKPSKVEFFDCTTRFLVRSESRPNEVHLVDLEADDRGRYECSCEDWHFRNPDWVQAPIPYECKHIALAKAFVFWQAEQARVAKSFDFKAFREAEKKTKESDEK